jgi:hypothetical protein
VLAARAGYRDARTGPGGSADGERG